MNNSSPLVPLVLALSRLINSADKHRNAYFFRPIQGAGSRRSYERYHTHGPITWTESGHTFTAAYTVTCTCSAIYARGEYTRDGKRTTLTAIRNSYNRMKEAYCNDKV